ncbi:hypothetical protein D3C71_1401390 [compost metagenome]
MENGFESRHELLCQALIEEGRQACFQRLLEVAVIPRPAAQIDLRRLKYFLKVASPDRFDVGFVSAIVFVALRRQFHRSLDCIDFLLDLPSVLAWTQLCTQMHPLSTRQAGELEGCVNDQCIVGTGANAQVDKILPVVALPSADPRLLGNFLQKESHVTWIRSDRNCPPA